MVASAIESKDLHGISRVEEESSQSGDNACFFFMIDNNAHPSGQLVHQQILVSNSPTLVMVSLGNQQCHETCP
jgi:hypothetical protein